LILTGTKRVVRNFRLMFYTVMSSIFVGVHFRGCAEIEMFVDICREIISDCHWKSM